MATMSDRLSQLHERAGSPSFRDMERAFWRRFGDDGVVSAETLRRYHRGRIKEDRCDSLLVLALAGYYGVRVEDISGYHASWLEKVHPLWIDLTGDDTDDDHPMEAAGSTKWEWPGMNNLDASSQVMAPENEAA